MTQGILYRYVIDFASEEVQLVVPKHKRKEILHEYHSSPTSCHNGSERTLTRIKKNITRQEIRRM